MVGIKATVWSWKKLTNQLIPNSWGKMDPVWTRVHQFNWSSQKMQSPAVTAFPHKSQQNNCIYTHSPRTKDVGTMKARILQIGKTANPIFIFFSNPYWIQRILHKNHYWDNSSSATKKSESNEDLLSWFYWANGGTLTPTWQWVSETVPPLPMMAAETDTGWFKNQVQKIIYYSNLSCLKGGVGTGVEPWLLIYSPQPVVL